MTYAEFCAAARARAGAWRGPWAPHSSLRPLPVVPVERFGLSRFFVAATARDAGRAVAMLSFPGVERAWFSLDHGGTILASVVFPSNAFARRLSTGVARGALSRYWFAKVTSTALLLNPDALVPLHDGPRSVAADVASWMDATEHLARHLDQLPVLEPWLARVGTGDGPRGDVEINPDRLAAARAACARAVAALDVAPGVVDGYLPVPAPGYLHPHFFLFKEPQGGGDNAVPGPGLAGMVSTWFPAALLHGATVTTSQGETFAGSIVAGWHGIAPPFLVVNHLARLLGERRPWFYRDARPLPRLAPGFDAPVDPLGLLDAGEHGWMLPRLAWTPWREEARGNT